MQMDFTTSTLMQMDFVSATEEAVEETDKPDYTAPNPDVCMILPASDVLLCSDRNRDGSFCRRIDCKSNETTCQCDEGKREK